MIHRETWRDKLIARHPNLFRTIFDGEPLMAGFSDVGDGWRELVETALIRIEAAVAGAPTGSAIIVQIKPKFGRLRLSWVENTESGWGRIYFPAGFPQQLRQYHGRALSDSQTAAVEEAIDLAVARSACTCATCGAPGRLYDRSRWLLTACDQHAQGKLVREPSGEDNLHLTRDGVHYRRYVRETDSFEHVPPSPLGFEE
ncbi:hypothetical protein [Bradyrhizobium sp. ARR65]|uniref:hypothetical protein n=1 Tax=Bradyrhizobium sp. ARR65 TaxID=1040989 RepID=UPI000466EB04|nr:hypothetical protein [Bradyrhizobium sp. ARR65]